MEKNNKIKFEIPIFLLVFLIIGILGSIFFNVLINNNLKKMILINFLNPVKKLVFTIMKIK